MQSIVIFIQRTILWLISIVLTAIVGFLGGTFFMQHLHNEAEKETEEAELEEQREKVVEIKRKHDRDATVVKFNSEASKNWSPDLEMNALIVSQVRNWANDRLKAQEFVFLNELYAELALPRTFRGQILGWHISNGNSIEIAMTDPTDDGSLTLTFNVDGDILNLLS